MVAERRWRQGRRPKTEAWAATGRDCEQSFAPPSAQGLERDHDWCGLNASLRYRSIWMDGLRR